jgi:hypothetical protein
MLYPWSNCSPGLLLALPRDWQRHAISVSSSFSGSCLSLFPLSPARLQDCAGFTQEHDELEARVPTLPPHKEPSGKTSHCT